MPLFLSVDEYGDAVERLGKEVDAVGSGPGCRHAGHGPVRLARRRPRPGRGRGTEWMGSLYGIPPKAFERHLVAGTADEVAARVAEYRAVGAEHVADLRHRRPAHRPVRAPDGGTARRRRPTDPSTRPAAEPRTHGPHRIHRRHRHHPHAAARPDHRGHVPPGRRPRPVRRRDDPGPGRPGDLRKRHGRTAARTRPASGARASCSTPGCATPGSSTSTTRAPAGPRHSTWPPWPTLGGAGTVLAVGVEKMWTGHRMETLAGIEDGVPEADRAVHARQLGEPVGLGAHGPQRQVDDRAHGGVGHHRRTDRLPRPSRPASTAPSTPTPSSRAR